MEGLTDKSHAIHSHPKRFTREDKAKVIQYKVRHPHKLSENFRFWLFSEISSENEVSSGNSYRRRSDRL